MHIGSSSSASKRRISWLLLAGVLTGSALLASAPTALGFGFVTKWGGQGVTPGNFNHPEAVATDRAGNVYVVDHSERVLQKFTARGALIGQWKPDAGAEVCGCGIATDDAGHLYVIGGGKTTRNWRVLKYNLHGKLIDRWAPTHLPVGSVPGGIATDKRGSVYVAMGSSVEKFSSKGDLLARWKPTVPGPHGPVRVPASGIAADAAGDVYVAGGTWAAKFDGEGDLLAVWGPGRLSAAFGIATTPVGHVFISDAKLNQVFEFTSEGAFLGQFGRTGSGNGEFRGPHSLGTDSRGDLYVADTSNNRVQKFGEPSSAFELTKVTLDRRHGSARLIANVAGVGRLDVGGAGIKAVHRVAKGAGEVVLPIAPTGQTWAALAKGRAVVEFLVTYTSTTPGPAASASRSRRITLKIDR
jgi:tripartite motif-containing protein 71